MTLVKKLFVIYLERKRLDNMWKVLVIICMAGYDCTAFQQAPMQYYHSYDECVSVAGSGTRSPQSVLITHETFFILC